MRSLTGYKRHIATFYDSSGAFVGSHVFSSGFKLGLKKKTFEFNNGSYNINPSVSRSFLGNLFFDSYVYTYQIDNPDPYLLANYHHPIMSPKNYNTLLESNKLKDLNDSRRGGISALLTPRNIMIAIVVIGALIYFVMGGNVS